MKPWDENALNTHMLKSPLDRTFFKGPSRYQDFNVWTRPKTELGVPITIFEAGNTKESLEKKNQL